MEGHDIKYPQQFIYTKKKHTVPESGTLSFYFCGTNIKG